MQGAREYAELMPTGIYGKLRIVSGEHARGKYFHVYVGLEGNEVEVYGILGGNPGWTEYYGWKHKGPWQEDFNKELESRKLEVAEQKRRHTATTKESEEKENARIQSVLESYSSLV
jgi:hypothetical protein